MKTEVSGRLDEETFLQILELYGKLVAKLHEAGIIQGSSADDIARRYGINR